MNNSIRTTIVSLLLFLCSFIVNGQAIYQSSRNYYLYQGNTYHVNALGTILQNHKSAHKLYQQGLDKRDSAKVFGALSIGAMTLGTLAIVLDNEPPVNCSIFCPTGGEVIGVLLWGIVVPVTGVIGVILKVSGDQKLSKSLTLFNEANHKEVGYNSLQSSIDISMKVTQTGMGFVMDF